MYLPGLPYHVVQRGNNREACFIEPENYQFYLVLWEELSRRYGLSVHAFKNGKRGRYPLFNNTDPWMVEEGAG
ncbi:MAG: hypothetical protein A2151_09715 [Candidatus Muproteobacteria bacterium RBG_16_65_34]|uniref:Transposase n=1 Tax=Candidatus Muproteobacteria bacterium RBG_16_65_34 TaxID=1817760 RepID=A0A1F6TLU0_9PROT|nr:MAG: hypothetical protein A2151_09715 [Candidatus Muproteobacteria bacterium RBG_16_65_34]